MHPKFYAIFDNTSNGIIEIDDRLAIYTSYEKAAKELDYFSSPKSYNIKCCRVLEDTASLLK